MADGSYRFQSGAGQYYYQHNQQPRHLQQRNGSPVNPGRAGFSNDTPSPSRSPGPQSPAHNPFSMYAQNHQQGQHLMTNGGPNHQRYAMQMNMARFQHPGHQHQAHQQHPSQPDHVGQGGHGINFAGHQHTLSAGGLSANSNQYTQNNISNGTPSSVHSALSNAPNEHWKQQIALWQQSRDATTAHYHARTSPHVKQGVLAVATNGARREPEKEERHRASGSIELPRQEWMSLDFGGQGLKIVSAALFDYDFLDKLYFNNNKLSSLPPAIGRLRNLTHLDLSQNNLQELPPEMGMLVNLKSLLLFDNQLETIPEEMGSLYQLEVLGIEGNPFNEDLMSIMKTEGTRALISHLRESAAVPEPPSQRDWIDLDDPISDAAPPQNKFSVLTYNILCNRYATKTQYGYTSQTALSWEHRKEIILEEIRSHNADIVCLQEVDSECFNEYLRPALAHNDYKGVWWQKTRSRTMTEKESKLVDGCATFYKNSRYVLLDKKLIDFANTAINRPDMKSAHDVFNRVMPRDDIAIVTFLEERVTGARLIVANAHIYWNPVYKDVKLVQVAILMEQVTKLAEQYTKWPACADKVLYRYANGDAEGEDELPQDVSEPGPSMEYSIGSQIPLVVAGDFNSMPGSAVYDLLAHGALANSHSDLATRNYGDFTRNGMNHPFSLKSSYSHIGELSFTNYTPGFAGVLDYIWYSHNTLSVTGLLGEVDKDYLTRVPGFPNYHFPSDHLAILAQFAMKSKKEAKAVEVDFGPQRDRRRD